MFINGVIWVPPIPPTERGRKKAKDQEREREREKETKRVTFAPEPAVTPAPLAAAPSAPPLSDEDQEEFFEILRAMNTSRDSIRNAMIFVMDHAPYAAELVEILTESLTLKETPMMTKVRMLPADCSAEGAGKALFAEDWEAHCRRGSPRGRATHGRGQHPRGVRHPPSSPPEHWMLHPRD